MAITTNQFKNGNHIDVDGVVFKILEFQHVKPGKGGAFVRTKLRRAVRRRRDRPHVPRRREVPLGAHRVAQDAVPLRRRRPRRTSWTSSSYEQLDDPGDARSPTRCAGCAPSDEVDVLFIDDAPADLQLPSAVDLEVTETEPGLRGDTASGGGTKPATLETGAQVHVPLFVNIGDRVRVDTRSGDYVSRA